MSKVWPYYVKCLAMQQEYEVFAQLRRLRTILEGLPDNAPCQIFSGYFHEVVFSGTVAEARALAKLRRTG